MKSSAAAACVALDALVAALLLAGCGVQRAPSEASSALPSATASASAAPVRAPSARLVDPMWQRAAGEDDAEKQRLAETVGATELVDALDDGGEVAKTALAALPFARDADLALGPLAAKLVTADAADKHAMLEALRGIAGRPRDQRDPLDIEGARAAATELVALATDDKQPREDRALAVSAARALAAKGFGDPTKIPTALDAE